MALSESDDAGALRRYKIVIRCDGAPANEGEQAAKNITQTYRRRPWPSHVICEYDGKYLILTAENDWDEQGLALSDKFSDLISAFVRAEFEGDFAVVVEPLGPA